MMKRKIACLMFLVGALAASSSAAPTVLYITFNGSDAAACTRVAPCRTITHALSVVAPGGIVDIAASGIYDTFAVTTSVTVTTDPGVVATISVPASGTGIHVNAASTDVVALKGLTLLGSASGTGISIKSAGTVTVEDCDSRNFFHALEYVASVAGTLKVEGGTFAGTVDTSIFLCCNSGPTMNIAIDGAHILGGPFAGINVDAAFVAVTHTWLTGDPGCGGNGNHGIYVVHGTAVVENDVISGHCVGITVADTACISSNTITGNTVGIWNFGGTAFTRGNNTVENNGTNLAGTPLTGYSGQ
jgi:hypothetical protein